MTKNWISKNNFDKLSLKQLIVPGTHNSGTYQLNLKSKSTDPNFPKILNKTVNKWAKTQNLTIYEQLCSGARYLDFRIKKENDKLLLIHGLTGIRLETVFEEVMRFSIEEPNEPIMIDCNHIYFNIEDYENNENLTPRIIKDNIEKQICEEIENAATIIFKNKLVNNNIRFDMPLNQVVGKIWLFTTKGERFFRSSSFRSWWANTDNEKELKEYVDSTIFDENKMNISQFILTIQPKTIIASYLNPFNKDTLEYYVKHKVNKNIQDMLISLKNKHVNVILVDFIESIPDILNWCISSNYS